MFRSSRDVKKLSASSRDNRPQEWLFSKNLAIPFSERIPEEIRLLKPNLLNV